MFLRFATGCLVAAAMIVANGCCTMRPSACGVVGGGCGTKGCDSCASSAPVGYQHRNFLGHVHSTLTCGSGCGELYWGEWTSDPPDACDPCDDCGNWTGAKTAGVWGEALDCGPVCWHPFQGLRNLWGYRYASGGYDTGCDTCGSTEMDYIPMDYQPADMPSGDTLQAPPPPKPAPPKPADNVEDQQAANRTARGGQVTNATYPKAR